MDTRADLTSGVHHCATGVATGLPGGAAPKAAAIVLERDEDLVERIDHLTMALDNMSQGLCMFDARLRLVICNRRYYEIFTLPYGALSPGMTQEEIVTVMVAGGCYPPSITVKSICATTQAAVRSGTARPYLRELADGRTISILSRSLDGGGWVSTFEDVSEQQQSKARIEYLARHDGLTELANPRSLRDDSHRLLTPGLKTPILAVYHLDLDRFKFVNDTYGHDVGDELLRAVACRLRNAAGLGARVGRLGGDEFAILKRLPVIEDALVLAKALMAEVTRPCGLSAGRVEIGLSIGLTAHHGAVADLESLLQEADLALREAKATARGTISQFHPAMLEAALERRTLEAELQAALAADQFEVHYQPLVDIDGHNIVGVEALVRWRHPLRGLVSPSTFIPVAEEIGLIVPLGEWVLRRACLEAREWPAHVVVAVNVSSLQMRQKGFGATVLRILSETAMPPNRLEIELTESALLDESDIIMCNLNELRGAGIRFALDDFGTGYSSLSYLRRFQFDKIKIDRSFIKDADSSADAIAIIRAVAGLGKSLGITTLIEGVETSAQLDLARAEGVEQAQGYLLSRAQPSNVLTALLREMACNGNPKQPCAAKATIDFAFRSKINAADFL